MIFTRAGVGIEASGDCAAQGNASAADAIVAMTARSTADTSFFDGMLSGFKSSTLRTTRPDQGMITEESPHLARRVDTLARAADEPLRQRCSTGPRVAASDNCIEQHGR